MKRFRAKIRLTKAGKKVVASVAVGMVVLALLLFFILFNVDRVEVVGSTKYTDEQIKEYALGSPLTTNSMLVTWFESHIVAEDIPFVDSFDLERLDRHSIRIHVNEKKIVGYVVQGTEKLYFDKDGLVVEQEAMNEEELAQMKASSDELEELKKQKEQEEALEKANAAEEALTGKVDSKDDSEDSKDEDDEDSQDGAAQTQSIQAEEVTSGNEDATEFHAAVTDVPRVIGLFNGTIQVGKEIPVEDNSVFNTILGITRIVEKYNILPEMVYFNENMEITLVYNEGNIHCNLGKDTLLEEKITRVAAILPQLKGKTGVLHLEDYTADTTNIIFSQEALYTLKSIIAAAEGAEETAGTAAADDGVQDGTGTEAGDGTGTEAGDGAQDGTGTEAGDGTQDGTGAAAGDGTQDGTGAAAGDGAQDGTGAAAGDGAQDGTGAAKSDAAEDGTASGTGTEAGDGAQDGTGAAAGDGA